jgi:hypothetical protein
MWFNPSRVREMCQSCQTWPANFGQILLRTDTRLVFCNRKLMRTDIFTLEERCLYLWLVWFSFMVLNATFSNISAMSWRSVLLVEETGGSGENHRPVTNHWQTWSHIVVSSTPHHEQSLGFPSFAPRSGFLISRARAILRFLSSTAHSASQSNRLIFWIVAIMSYYPQYNYQTTESESRFHYSLMNRKNHFFSLQWDAVVFWNIKDQWFKLEILKF